MDSFTREAFIMSTYADIDYIKNVILGGEGGLQHESDP